MRSLAALFLGLVITGSAFAKCESMSLKDTTPTKFLVYHTDKMHKTAYAKYPINYALDHNELSDSETLFHISHGKKKDKQCSMYLTGATDKSSLKQKDFLLVKSAAFENNKFTMNLDDKNFASIVCTGVATLGDLKDVMEPYLMFTCKDKMAYAPKAEAANRLPASSK